MDYGAIKRLSEIQDNVDVRKIIGNRDEVLKRFGPIFRPEAVGTLKENDFREFLRFEHNKHWTGLGRQSSTYADMKKLRETLSNLVNESKPIRDRVNTATEVAGMGPAKVSAILLVAYPDKYGVWNGISEAGLQHLDLWPDFPRGATIGDKFVSLNQVLHDLAIELKVDLWTLDALWWGLDLNGAPSLAPTGTGKVRIGDSREKAIADMKFSILNTVKNSNGQTVETTVKNKDLKLLERELEALLPDLLAKQNERCAITGLPFQYDGDSNMRPSPDRIDSNGDYEEWNLQLVCKFINFWKRATPDIEFRRLIQVVRDGKSTDT